jgi:hypothetical protein
MPHSSPGRASGSVTRLGPDLGGASGSQSPVPLRLDAGTVGATRRPMARTWRGR